jgi:hypothetical protein
MVGSVTIPRSARTDPTTFPLKMIVDRDFVPTQPDSIESAMTQSSSPFAVPAFETPSYL